MTRSDPHRFRYTIGAVRVDDTNITGLALKFGGRVLPQTLVIPPLDPTHEGAICQLGDWLVVDDTTGERKAVDDASGSLNGCCVIKESIRGPRGVR